MHGMGAINPPVQLMLQVTLPVNHHNDSCWNKTLQQRNDKKQLKRKRDTKPSVLGTTNRCADVPDAVTENTGKIRNGAQGPR